MAGTALWERFRSRIDPILFPDLVIALDSATKKKTVLSIAPNRLTLFTGASKFGGDTEGVVRILHSFAHGTKDHAFFFHITGPAGGMLAMTRRGTAPRGHAFFSQSPAPLESRS